MEQAPQPNVPPTPSQPSGPGVITYLLFIFAALGVVGGLIVGEGLSGLMSVFELTGLTLRAVQLGVGLVVAAALVVPLVGLAWFTRWPRFRMMYVFWSVLGVTFGLLLFLRLLPANWKQAVALAQSGLFAVLLIGVLGVSWWRGYRPGWSLAPWLIGLFVLPVVVWPAVLRGALGSPSDVVLNSLAGGLLGLFFGILMDASVLGAIFDEPHGVWRDSLRAGLVACVGLLIVGTGMGFNGTQLLLMLVLPGVGLAGAIIGLTAGKGQGAWQPIAALVGGVAMGITLFFDPMEFDFHLPELLGVAYTTAGLMMGMAWLASIGVLIGAAILLTMRVQLGWVFKGAVSVLALMAWIGTILGYVFIGQPGWYGDRFFVILRDQGNVSTAYTMTDREARLTYVYSTLTAHANSTQSNLRSILDTLRTPYTPYYLMNAIEVDGGPLARFIMSLQPEVDRIIDSPRLRPLPDPLTMNEGTESLPSQPLWNITAIGADRVWDELGVTGEGIVVGNSDTGVQGDHTVLRQNYRGFNGSDDYNWYDPWNNTRSPIDFGGHGTHTTGTIVGRQGIGVAPGAQWIACVNLARDLANPPLYLDCMQFMLAPFPYDGDPFTDGDPTKAAHVLNNSWGCPDVEGCDANALLPAVGNLRAAGIFVVASAGNDGPTCSSVNSPIALYDDVFSVGAINSNGNLASFSSRGPVMVDGSGRLKPDILAPGVDVLSSTPGNTYDSYGGTSMAGPHIVGVVALMWSANPDLIGDIDRTEQILRDTAQPYQGRFPADTCGNRQNITGAGVVDAFAAVQAALADR